MDTIMSLFRKFKLGNSLFTSSYSISVEELEALPEIGERIARDRVVAEMSDFIFNKCSSSISQRWREDGKVKEYRIQLLVLKMQDFKTIVEAAIQEMPKEALDKIRGL